MTATLHSIEAEAALLGALLIDDAIAAGLRDRVRAEDFVVPGHAVLWRQIHEMVGRGEKVTPLTLRPQVEHDPAVSQLGGTTYLARLTADGVGLLAAPELAEQIADMAARRRAIEALNRGDVPLADVAEQLRQHDAAVGPAKQLPMLDVAAMDAPPPARRAAWGTWLPLLQTTMLTGPGGVGKSLFCQHLGAAMALGMPFMGLDTMRMRVLYLTCEDDADELWRRQAAICNALGRDAAELAGWLHLVSLAGDDMTALARFSNDGHMVQTDRWRAVVDLVRRASIGLVILDNATDLFAGDGNDLHAVARFINMLTGLAIECGGAVLLLHHPAKGGAEWLGSVAWENKVRNRLFIKRDDGPDPDARVIESGKANYGRTGERIPFRWHAGAFVRDDELPASVRSQLDEVNGAHAANEAFLRCLDVCTAKRRAVSHSPAANHAPKVFEGMVDGKGWKRADFAAAMERLLHMGVIEVDAELWMGPDRHPRRGIRRAGALL